MNSYDWYVKNIEQNGEVVFEKKYTTAAANQCDLEIIKSNGKYYRKLVIDGQLNSFEEMKERDVYTVLMGVHKEDVSDKRIHEILENETR